jgi:hypothetical protein
VRIRILAMVIFIIMLCGTASAFAASDPAVTIVSPSQAVYGNSLLISIKITAQKTIRVSLYEEKEKAGDKLISIDPTSGNDLAGKSLYSVSIMTPEIFKGKNNLQFYSKQISDVTPGLYKVKADTLDTLGIVTASSDSRFVVMPKESETAEGSVIFETQQTGAFQWVQNLLKTIFGN